ncbi:hypothetical protein AAC387_Pa09g0998 [Persea americana]
MDKTCSTLDSRDPMVRIGQEYRDRVKSFIEFAKAKRGMLLSFGASCRIYHGETTPHEDDVVKSEHGGENDYVDWDEYPEMMKDHYMGTYIDTEAI